jgi:rubredoxin
MVEDNKPPEVYNCEEKGHKWVDLDVIFHCRMCKKEKSKD